MTGLRGMTGPAQGRAAGSLTEKEEGGPARVRPFRCGADREHRAADRFSFRPHPDRTFSQPPDPACDPAGTIGRLVEMQTCMEVSPTRDAVDTSRRWAARIRAGNVARPRVERNILCAAPYATLYCHSPQTPAGTGAPILAQPYRRWLPPAVRDCVAPDSGRIACKQERHGTRRHVGKRRQPPVDILKYSY